MRSPMWMVCLFAVATAAQAQADESEDKYKPLPGRDVVAPMEPDWCADAELEDWLVSGSHPDDALNAGQRQVDSGWSEKTLRVMAEGSCVRPKDPTYQKRVAQWRQRWINLG